MFVRLGLCGLCSLSHACQAEAPVVMQDSVVLLSADGASCTFVGVCCKVVLHFFHATHGP